MSAETDLLLLVAADAAQRVDNKRITARQPGTVVGFDPDTGTASVLIDGDDQPTDLLSVSGTPVVNDRVMVEFPPPHGVQLAGWVPGGASSGNAGPQGPQGPSGGDGPPGPSSGRIEISGHSYAAENIHGPHGPTNPQNGETRDEAGWTDLLRDTLTPGSVGSRYLYTHVPAVAAGSDAETLLAVLPEDALIEGVWYVPNANLTGANTNTRRIEVQILTFVGLTTFGARQFDSGVNLTKAVVQPIVAPFAAGADLSVRPKSGATTLFAHAWFQESLVYESTATTSRPNVLNWKSVHVGTGLADPGGLVIVRLGTKFVNTAQGGALALMGGVHMGGWSAQFAAHRPPHAVGVEVLTTGSLAVNGTGPLAVQALSAPIPSGWKIRMFGGATLTVNDASVTTGDTAITIAADGHAAVSAGEQGFATPGTTGDTVAADGTHIVNVGINDAPWWSPPDRSAWRETIRTWIALKCCPVLFPAASANHVTTNGSGVVENHIQPAGGQWELITPYGLANGIGKLVRSGNGWTITCKVAPHFPGGYLDLFWAALCGTGVGVRASITLDGVAAGTLDTSSASPTANLQTGLTATTLAGVPFLVGTGFNQTMIGRRIEHAAVPVGSIAGFVNDAGTAITITNPVTGASVNASSDQTSQPLTIRGYVPMVKRIPAAAGAHTLVITGTGIDATNGTAAAVFLSLGWEVPTRVLVANIAHLPSGFADSTITDYNTDTSAVIAGTAAAVGTGSVDPAFGAGVELWDIDTILGADATRFLGDELHPDSLGGRLLAADAIGHLREQTLTEQLTR